MVWKVLPTLIFIVLVCCTSPEPSTKETEKPVINSLPSPSPPVSKTDLYAVQLNSQSVSLRQWDSTINLSQELGIPILEKTKQLDRNSDTHSGSYIKDLVYDGIKLKLFSPKQNGKTFWIMEMILTNKKFSTTKGVRLGDSLDKVKKIYPELKLFPGNSPDMYFVSDAGYEKSIEMEFNKDTLKKLRMYYMIP